MPFELTTAMLITDVANEPAVSRPTPCPAAMTARAPSARRSAPASAVAETNPSSGSWLRPSGSGMIAARGFGAERSAIARARSTTPRMPASSRRFVLATPIRSRSMTRTWSCASCSRMFWWIRLLAKRVSAASCPM